jgi:hypothetical protein
MARPISTLERADDEFTNGDGAAVNEERTNAQIRVDAFHFRGIDAAVGKRRDGSVPDAFAQQAPRDRDSAPCRHRHDALTNRTEVGRNLVSQHLFQAKAEQVGRIPAVGPRHHIAAEAGRSPRAPVTGRATVAEARTDGEIDIDVPEAVSKAGALPFQSCELALKELPAAANRPERIEGNHVLRGVQVRTGPALSDLAGIGKSREGAGNSIVCSIWSLVAVDQLAEQPGRDQHQHKQRRANRTQPHRDTPCGTPVGARACAFPRLKCAIPRKCVGLPGPVTSGFSWTASCFRLNQSGSQVQRRSMICTSSLQIVVSQC